MSWLAALCDFLKPNPPPDAAARAALARIGELVDPLLKVTPGFERKLAGPVHHALGYCEGLVAALPGPMDVGRRAFGGDPLVHALFATAGDIGGMFGGSQAVRDYLDTPAAWQSEHFYALLAARREEKRQLGVAMQGDVVHVDVPQTVVYFHDHILAEPQGDPEALRARLHSLAFDSLLQSFRAHVEALRLEKGQVSSDRSVERAHLTVLRGQGGEGEIAVGTRRLAELDAHLRSVAESLQPDRILEALATYLLKPEMSLRLDPVTINVDRLGVVTAADASDAVTLSFPELCGRDRRHHLVVLARIDCEEARQALAAASFDRERRFMVI